MKKDPKLVLFGKHIRSLRKEAGYSQESFATEVGLDRSYMGGIERGERNISTLTAMQIAIALGVEVGDLFPPIKSLKKAK
jgi:transcriptional regulator with XRE-family HTH domain